MERWNQALDKEPDYMDSSGDDYDVAARCCKTTAIVELLPLWNYSYKPHMSTHDTKHWQLFVKCYEWLPNTTVPIKMVERQEIPLRLGTKVSLHRLTTWSFPWPND